MNAASVVTSWAGKWRNLRAWQAPLPAVVVVEAYRGGGVLGRAYESVCERRAEIYLTGDLAEDLATALHELAHLAAPRNVQHGPAWRAVFAAGACEALGLDADAIEPEVTPADLDAQVTRACRAWLTRTGQRAFLRALGVRL